jgi:hypothetical protein
MVYTPSEEDARVLKKYTRICFAYKDVLADDT